MSEPALETPPLRACAADVAGVEVVFDRSGAAWLPNSRTLLVADLHFEKGSAFAARGAPLPPYDTRATLARLSEAIGRCGARAVVALGDSFHDLDADGRMAPEDRDGLAGLVASVADWVWIEGNHDPAPPTAVGGVRAAELDLGPLRLRHEPRGADGEVAGHLHPCAKVARRGRAVRRRCFAADATRLVLPGFGAFTGGLNVCDPAYDGLLGEDARAFMLGRDAVWPVARRSWLPD
jgi:DNA ligase-associated metallophosphoesterase